MSAEFQLGRFGGSGFRNCKERGEWRKQVYAMRYEQRTDVDGRMVSIERDQYQHVFSQRARLCVNTRTESLCMHAMMIERGYRASQK